MVASGLSLRLSSRRLSGVALPRKQEEQADADADGAVRDVEGGKASDLAIATDDVEVEEIDDVLSAGQQAINEVADDAAKDEAERNLSAKRVNVEVMAGKKEDEESDDGDDGQRTVIPGEHAPSCASVSPVNEFEEATDNFLLLRKAQVSQDDELRQLVEEDDGEGEVQDAPV